MQKKRGVSMLELFYDLIFVFAISQMSEVLLTAFEGENLHMAALVKYGIVVLVFWSVWTYQTVFINRFFKASLTNYIFILINMFIVMILSQSINIDFQETFTPFVVCTSMLYTCVLLQYCLTLFYSNSVLERQFIISIILVLSICILSSIVALILPVEIRIVFYGISIFTVSFLPLAFRKSIESVPVDFEHLAERYSLFVILFFGESIIAVAKTININSIHMISIVYFLIIIALFSIYSLIYTKGIEKKKETGGLVLIHTHYFLILSIGFVSLLLEENIHHQIKTMSFSILLTMGVSLFLAALLANWICYGVKKIKMSDIFIIVTLLVVFLMNNLLVANLTVCLGINMILLWFIFATIYRRLVIANI
ncbi:low temperature requirement protein A [Listeria aquatica]|uniref:low temperature requirement protein A n=1 Tax=Listeria aquatica TaxID=1494960 RepID=UPI003F71D575